MASESPKQVVTPCGTFEGYQMPNFKGTRAHIVGLHKQKACEMKIVNPITADLITVSVVRSGDILMSAMRKATPGSSSSMSCCFGK